MKLAERIEKALTGIAEANNVPPRAAVLITLAVLQSFEDHHKQQGNYFAASEFHETRVTMYHWEEELQ